MQPITPQDAGCWLDGAIRGCHTGEAVQEIAKSYGWDGIVSAIQADDYDDATQDAEDYLQSLAPEGYSFGWNAGDFLLMSDTDWESIP